MATGLSRGAAPSTDLPGASAGSTEAAQAAQERWSRLDPIFILGMQRSGTTVVWKALQTAGFIGFPEGHLWLDLVEAFARFRDPEYMRHVREEIFLLGAGRNLELEREFALLMDRFQRERLPADLVRWVDKTPGARAVRLAPMLAAMFPRGQIIFMKRNPISVVESSVQRHPQIFRSTCAGWRDTMAVWRRVRGLLQGRFLGIAQEHVAEQPDGIARTLCRFLGTPQSASAVAAVFREQRLNTSFRERRAGDYGNPVQWSGRQRAMLGEICGGEMRFWGYPLDFECPGGPDPGQAVEPPPSDLRDFQEFCRWIAVPPSIPAG